MPYLKPHSHAWFTALEAANPQQATMTRQVLKRTGRDDVCGVCGDDPAIDYMIAGVKMPSGETATVRLCEECRDMRGKLHGERFETCN